MTTLFCEIQCDETTGDGTGIVYDGDAVVRLSNEAAENGYEQEPGPLTWFNSARIVADPDDDAVRCSVSVGDPRGAFVFTVRRLPDGQIVIHVPHPGESLPHVETTKLHDGTLLVAGNYADEEETTYKIVRFFADSDRPMSILDDGLTLDEAQDHCSDEESSSRTATNPDAVAYTEEMGAWFDGYEVS